MDSGQAIGAIIDILLRVLAPVYTTLGVVVGLVILARALDGSLRARRRRSETVKKRGVGYRGR